MRLEEREINAGIYRLYKDLLALRASDPVFSHNDRATTRPVALTSQAVAVHRWHGDEHRLLLANFGKETALDLSGIPSLPVGWHGWSVMLSSAWSRFGGDDVKPEDLDDGIVFPARTAMIWEISPNT